MSLRAIATAVWENAIPLPFSITNDGPRPFSDAWFARDHPDLPCGKDSRVGARLRGWYWLATDLSNQQLMEAIADLPAPERRPKGTERYRSIGDRAAESLQDIAPYICAESFNGLRVVYNGHEAWARGRLGGHYMTLNTSTGALRLSQHASLQRRGKWCARIFTEDMIERLRPSLRDSTKVLVASKLGRNIVELEWRSRFGWPLLCRA